MTALSLLLVGMLGQDERPRIREELPNGVQILAVKSANPGKAVVSVFASARGLGDEPGSHGIRHLLEHLMAKGPDGSADRTLETEGVLLTAKTTRAGVWFSTSGPSSKVALSVEVLGRCVSAVRASEEEILREVSIMAQERKVMAPWWGFDAEAWKASFGAGAVDPFGDLELLGKVTPDVLEIGRMKTFAGNAVGVVVMGDIEPSVVVMRCKDAFGSLTKGATLRPARRPEALTGRVRLRGERGESRSVVVTGIGSGSTAATVGMAMVLASKVGGSVAYEPSLQPGIVTIWTKELAGLGTIDAYSSAEVVELFPQARAAASTWFRSVTGSLENRAGLEAMLLTEKSVSTVEVLGSYPMGATDSELRAAFERFKAGMGIEVDGS